MQASKLENERTQEKICWREQIKRRVQNGYPISMRELSDLIGCAYQDVRKWNKSGWLPLINGKKLFYESFRIAILREHFRQWIGKDCRHRRFLDNNRDWPPLTSSRLSEWQSKNFCWRTLRPKRSTKSDRESNRILLQILAEHGTEGGT
jgi:hypothetical protein